ncbi:hypothetical protein [Rhizobium sp. BK418]|uniref:hypothetical protein n=1 Tax=Rhizobium sp. BK418 TaxID=2512120 RepID=UPI0010467C09|nr:hypothetical protein [Rhizobium sp. BK418]TCR95966.1 hypothetical protein EV281_11214 [Rhizobium sp. BK418]
MVKVGLLFCGTFLGLSVAAFAADGESCGQNYWPGTLPEHAVDSVSASHLQSFLDTAPIIDGIKFQVTRKGSELWLDVVSYPGDVTALASIRTIFIIGRVVKPEYSKLVLADKTEGEFQISYRDLHAIGCQFVWGVQGRGQNPIALNRDLTDALRYYPSGQRVAPAFTGSLLGDSSIMLNTLNNVVYPQWLFKTVEIK